MRLVTLVSWVLLAAVLRPAGAAPSTGLPVGDLYAVARSFEVQPLAARPAWATDPTPPLLRFAWMSDLHLDGGERTAMIRAACHTVRDLIRPDLVIVTGDNCAWDPPVRGDRARLPQAHRRHLAFQDFIKAEIGLPAVVLPGDNWPWDFDKVFGSSRFSFHAAGLHLVFLSPDRRAPSMEGCSRFDPPTWEWLEKDLEANRERPTLVFTHENLIPPTFLDAPRLLQVLHRHPQVLATFTGHLHLDLEFRRQGLVHLLCPAFAAGGRPGFKTVALYPDRLVVNTWEQDPGGGAFVSTLKWQRIDIPEGPLRRALAPLDRSRLLREGRQEMPAAPMVRDESLAARQGDLLPGLFQFMMEKGLETLLPATAP